MTTVIIRLLMQLFEASGGDYLVWQRTLGL